MTLPETPEALLAMLQQDRLQTLGRRAELDDRLKVIEASIGAVEMTLKIKAQAAEAAAAAAEATEERPD